MWTARLTRSALDIHGLFGMAKIWQSRYRSFDVVWSGAFTRDAPLNRAFRFEAFRGGVSCDPVSNY